MHVLFEGNCTWYWCGLHVGNAPISVKPVGEGLGKGWGFDTLGCPRGVVFNTKYLPPGE